MYLDLNYIRRGTMAKREALKTLGYNRNRPGSDNEEEQRILFGASGTPLSEEEAKELIENASKQTLFWRMILSPDPKTENKEKIVDLWQLTDELARYLHQELKRPVPYIGVVHNNTDIPHVHAILLIERFGREMLVTKKRIEALKQLALGQALEQKRNRLRMQPLAESLIEVRQQAQLVRRMTVLHLLGAAAERRRRGQRVLSPLCEDCFKPVRKGHWQTCEKRRERDYARRL